MKPCSFTRMQINHHSFMRWNEEGAKPKKEEKAVCKAFYPTFVEEDAFEKSFMLTAFSA